MNITLPHFFEKHILAYMFVFCFVIFTSRNVKI